MQNGIWRAAVPLEFTCGCIESDAGTEGYIVLGTRGDAVNVMELAAREGRLDVARALVAAACGQGAAITAYATSGSLVEQAFRALGADVPLRERGSTCIMVHILDTESTGRKVWNDVPELRDVEVRVWTPQREGIVHAPARAVRSLTLELKESMLSRLLMRRLDVACAVREERVTIHGDRPGDVESLARALKPCAWITQRLDYL